MAYWSICKIWRAVTGKPLQHPFDLVQASWAPYGGLGGWFHLRAIDVAAPTAGLTGIGHKALKTGKIPLYRLVYHMSYMMTSEIHLSNLVDIVSNPQQFFADKSFKILQTADWDM